MIQDMKSGDLFYMILQIIQEIICKRDHLITFPAYQMMMIVLHVTFYQVADLVPHTPVIQIDPVHKLHIPQKLQRTVYRSQPDFRIILRYQLIDILCSHMPAAVLLKYREDQDALVRNFQALFF